MSPPSSDTDPARVVDCAVMAGFDHTGIDDKWQTRWEKDKTFATPTDRTRPKYYVREMFTYPAGDGRHVEHP